MKESTKKSMTLEELTAYLEDLIRMGFVSEYTNQQGTPCYKLTKLGEKAGIAANIKKH
jgi:predicted transcriptional regulator